MFVAMANGGDSGLGWDEDSLHGFNLNNSSVSFGKR